MADTTLVRSKALVPRPRAELVTALFYAWERRGRGWQVWPAPVELEPPFRPVASAYAQVSRESFDDGRRHTLLSAVTERLIRGSTGRLRRATSAEPSSLPIEEPVPQVFADSAPVIELQVTLPPEAKIARDAAEHFLVSLTYGSRPVTFEVVGRQHSITVQFACRGPDVSTLREQLRAHFPDVAVTEDPGSLERAWESADPGVTLVVDFGLAHEFMRPFRTVKTLDPDPLIAVAGALGDLGDDEVAALQILFQPCRSPWAAEIVRAVADPEGRSFFADAPEMLSLARTKVGRPLFAVLLRVAARSRSEERVWGIVRALGGALAQFADPASNELIPLEPDGYESDEHEAAFLSRLTRRSGMLLNSEELVSLVHLPSASVRSEKLRRQVKKTKAAPASVAGHALRLGENVHAGRTTSVTLTPAQRTRHTYTIGASGTGKSTLLLNMIVQDLEAGAGIGVLDPHGDLVDRILGHVPDGRLDDVVLLAPAYEA